MIAYKLNGRGSVSKSKKKTPKKCHADFVAKLALAQSVHDRVVESFAQLQLDSLDIEYVQAKCIGKCLIGAH